MLSYVLARLAQSVLVLFLVSIVAFALVLLSGDPVAIMLPIHATDQDRRTLRHALGLDQPVAAQYLSFVGHLAQGDLGRSIKFNQPVLPLIFGKLPLTMALVVAAISMAVVIGIPVGILSGTRANGALDVFASVLALLTISFPPFWVGLMLILIVADYLRLLPTSGTGDLKHLILPAVTLSLHSTGLITLFAGVTSLRTAGDRICTPDELRTAIICTIRPISSACATG